jgi:hypothetical protein
MPITLRWFLGSLALVALTNACGDSPDDSRPVEFLYFVQGPTGARFEVVGPDDNADCMAPSRQQVTGLIPSMGYGFQSADATHQVSGTFQAPHYFVFENERQPTRGVFRNLGALPLTVLQLRGVAPPGTTLETRTIPPGECRSVSTFDDAEEMVGLAGPAAPDDEFRLEVCSFAAATRLPDGFRCHHLAPRGPTELDADGNLLLDAGAAFLGSIGDLTASFLTQCLQLENSERVQCLTPATFYLHEPQDQVSAAMTRLGNQPDSFLQVDLFRGDRLLASDRGARDAVVRDDI